MQQENDLSNSKQASYFFEQGDYVRAEELNREVLNARKRVLGPDHISTLQTMHNLAHTLERLERYEEAEKMYHDALERRIRVLGPYNIDTLQTMHDLARTLDSSGLKRYEEAEKVNRDVLERRIRVLGPDHIDTLKTMYNRALNFYHLHRDNEAEKIFRDVLEREKRVLGPDHIYTLDTMLHFVTTLCSLQRYDEAEKISRDALERRRRVLGPDHTNTLDAMQGLALSLCHLQRYSEAEKIFSDELAREKRVLGPDHIDTLQTMYNLALTLSELQRYDEAEKIYRDALERRRRVLGADHNDTLGTMHNLAHTLNRLKRYDEAEKICHDVLERENRVLGPDHEHTISTVHLLELIQRVSSFDFESLYETLCKESQLSFQSSMTQPIDWTRWIKKAGLIASGGNGDVYLATWQAIPAPTLAPPRVVMKTVRCAGVSGSTYLKFLKREIAILAGIKHQNIVPFVGVCHDEGNIPALVSLYMENGDVKAYLDRHPDVNREKINFDISQGLEYLHNHTWKIVHGDLKAANVLINSKDQACLTDFGLSMIVADGSLWSTSAIEARGTTRWMAPELLSGTQPKVHIPSDVYAFAMTSLEISTGNVPFAHLQHPGAVITAVVLRGERPSRPEAPPISDATWQLWQECWSEDPTHRPLMSEVVSRLKRRI